MAILSLQEIMEAHDITEKEHPVPEWNGEVVVRSISHKEMRKIRNKVEISSDGEPDEAEVEKWIFIEGLVNPKVDEDQYELLMEKSTTAISGILNAILGNSNAKKDAAKEEEKSLPDEPE